MGVTSILSDVARKSSKVDSALTKASRKASEIDQNAVTAIDQPLAAKAPRRESGIPLREDEAIASNVRKTEFSDEQVTFDPVAVNNREGVAVASEVEDGIKVDFWDGDSKVVEGATFDEAEGTVRGSGKPRGETDIGDTETVSRQVDDVAIQTEDVTGARRFLIKEAAKVSAGYGAVYAIGEAQRDIERRYGIKTPYVDQLYQTVLTAILQRLN